MLSASHLILLFLVALLVFGPEKLPELARNLSKAMAEFHRITGDFQQTVQREMRQLEREALDQQIRAKSPEPAAEPAALPASTPELGVGSLNEALSDDAGGSTLPTAEYPASKLAATSEEPGAEWPPATQEKSSATAGTEKPANDHPTAA